MDANKNTIFRQEALDSFSSPEDLDQLTNIVKPQTWIPLLSGCFLVATLGVWSVIGRIPLMATGAGVLIRPYSVQEIQTIGEGQLKRLYVRSGDKVNKGQLIGTIDRAGVTEELRQERAKLGRLKQEQVKNNRLQKQKVAQELAFLQQQQKDLKASLEQAKLAPVLHERKIKALQQRKAALQTNIDREKITPKLYNQKVASTAQQSSILKQQKQNLVRLLKNLEERQKAYRDLYEQRAISYNLFLQAQQQVINAKQSILEIDGQINNLEVQKTDDKRDYLRNLNVVDDLNNQLGELEIAKTEAELTYAQEQTKLNEINTKIQGLEAEKIRLNQQDFIQNLEQIRQIKEVQDKIAQLKLQLSQGSKIVAQDNGRILALNVSPGEVIQPGTPIGKIQVENADAQLQTLVYFDDKEGKKIEPGMEVQVTPSTVKREEYGGILGKVTEVSPFPVTTQNIANVVGNEELAQTLAATNGARIQVEIDLRENPQNQSGYSWTSSSDPDLEFSSGTTAQVRVKVGEVAPISYLIPLFRTWTGIN
ncbi:MAG: NHLP bacteriocin system secretion protein [Cyanobacteria bacterium P01_C01_bin.38]